MVKIVYIDVDGVESVVNARPDQSVMEAAVRNGVPGIVGECGGMRACATCRAHVDVAWRPLVGPPGKDEQEMLDLFDDDQEGARLTCQIKVRMELDGLTLRTPKSQYP